MKTPEKIEQEYEKQVTHCRGIGSTTNCHNCQNQRNHSPKKMTHLANGPWNKSLNFLLPTKYVIPESLKFSHLAK